MSTRSSGFPSTKSQSQRKLAKKITYFIIQFRSKNLTHFTNLNSLDIEKNMLPQHSKKPFSLYKCPSKHLVGVKKYIYLHCTISRRPRNSFSKHFKSKCCIFLYISAIKFLFQSRSKLLTGGIWRKRWMNNFFKATRCFGPRKMFYDF